MDGDSANNFGFYREKHVNRKHLFMLAALTAGCDGSGNGDDVAVSAGADISAPTVSATTPSLAAAAAPDANIKALFSEAMDGTTITAASFTLSQGTTPVLGTVTYEGQVATLNPIANLTAGTTFTATVNTGATDLAGNALARNRTWTFTTRAVTANVHARDAKQPDQG